MREEQISEIEIKKIMAMIREKIEQRKNEQVTTHNNSPIKGEDGCSYHNTKEITHNDFVQGLEFIRNNYDVHTDRKISSHRKLIGPLLVRIRQFLHEEFMRSFAPIVARQTKFNHSLVQLFDYLSQSLEEFVQDKERMRKQVSEILAWIKDIRNQQQENETIAQNVIQEMDRMKEQIGEVVDRIHEILAWRKDIDTLRNDIRVIKGNIENHLKYLRLLREMVINRSTENKKNSRFQNTLYDFNYLLFEDKYRGSEGDIKKRQAQFLPFFESCNYVLDIGCGRGEFLELLKERKINALGIEVNEYSYRLCRQKGLTVENKEVFSFLRATNKIFDGIFMGQVIEHFSPPQILELLKLCYQQLDTHGVMVITSANPCSLVSVKNFRIDVSHQQLLHPEAIKFLAESIGFAVDDIVFFSPVPDDVKLKQLEDVPENAISNHNITILNDMLFGYQDYAIIAKKK